MPVIGEAGRWRTSKEHGLLFNMRNARVSTVYDTACAVKVVPIPHAASTSYQIVRLDPYASVYTPPLEQQRTATSTPSSSSSNATRGSFDGERTIVHHMDLFVCDSRMVNRPVPDQDCITNPWLSEKGPCYALLWAYDKGALAPHNLPSDAGLRVGRGTNYSVLMLQVHYQLPVDGPIGGVRAADLRASNYHDSSGIVVSLVDNLRARDAWSFEFIAYSMAVPARSTGVVFASRLPSAEMQKMLAPDLKIGNGSVRLLQIHAHAHRHATRVRLQRTSSAGHTDTLFEINPYCGYGACQHFHDIPSMPALRVGDSLAFECTYTNTEALTLTYGLSRGNEMCGPVLIYAPHDPSALPRKTWHDARDGYQRSHEGGEWVRVSG
jgi:hypothetical protein